MKNNEWKIGDTVLCIETNPSKNVIAGNEYVIDGFTCCPKCGQPEVYIKGLNHIVKHIHLGCGYIGHGVQQKFIRRRFVKPDLSSLTAYRSTVTVREISVPKELKKLTELQSQ